MSDVFTILQPELPSRLNIVFIHGLGSDNVAAWQNDDKILFPELISKDIKNQELRDIGVLTVKYDASPSEWLGKAMPLTDRADELFETLRVKGALKVPSILVCHSMGGIIAKKMVQLIETQEFPELDNVRGKIKGIVFLSTPHSGSDAASYLKALGRILPLRPSESALELGKNSNTLRDLSKWFRNRSLLNNIRYRVYYEKHDTKGIRVVDDGSADPGIPGTRVVPVDADHFQVSKPNAGGLVHLGVLEFVQDIIENLPPAPPSRTANDEVKAGLSGEKRALVNILDDSPRLQSLAIDVLNSQKYPTVMSLGEKGLLVPNPCWAAPEKPAAEDSPTLSHRLRGHMFLSVAEPRGKRPHIKCYYSERWSAYLIPFFKHPGYLENYLTDVAEFAKSHYHTQALPTGKSMISVKRNEERPSELWLYCYEFYSLPLTNQYRSESDHRWFDLERLSDTRHREAIVNGDVVRALREHFGTGFHGVERSQVDSSELQIGDP